MVFKQIYDKGIIHGDINWNQRFRFGCSWAASRSWNNIRINDKWDIYVIDFDNSIIRGECDIFDCSRDLREIVKLFHFVLDDIDKNKTPLINSALEKLAKIDPKDISSYEELSDTIRFLLK